MNTRNWHMVATLACLTFAASPGAAQDSVSKKGNRVPVERPAFGARIPQQKPAEPMPDLVARACFFRPTSSPRGATNIGVTFDFSNLGKANAVILNGVSEWNITGPPNMGGGGTNVQPGYDFPAGTHKHGGLTMPSLSTLAEGTYTFTAMVDPGNKVAESDETNNTATCTLTITAPVGSKVDLVITALTLSNPQPTSTSAFNLLVTIKNQGTEPLDIPAGTLILGGDANVNSASEYGVTRLAVGATKTYTLGPTNQGAQRGTRTWSITVDPNNRIAESSKANNTSTISVTVR